MTEPTREQILDRIKELRLRANRLRESAQYADSTAAYQADLRMAARLDAEADELEATIFDRRAQR